MRLKPVATLSFLLLLILWTITTLRSYEQYKFGQEALQKKKYLEAITSFERGALFYAPYNNFSTKSIEELINLSINLKQNNPEFARQAKNGIERVQNQLSLSFFKPLPYFFLIGWFILMILFFFKGFDLRGKLQPAWAFSTFTFAMLSIFLLFLALTYS